MTYAQATTLNMSGSRTANFIQDILSSGWNALSFGTVTGVPGACILKNIDATNYFELATDNAGANKFAKVLANGLILLTPSSATIYAKANTATVQCKTAASEA